MQKLDKKNEITQAALVLIADRGFHGAPMAMIAEKSKVVMVTIYRYFENKDTLINSLYQELEKEIMATLPEDYRDKTSFQKQFLYLGTAYLV